MAVQQIMRMQPPADANERVQHEDIAVKWALWVAIGYVCLFGILGIIAAIKFVVPDLFWSVNWMSWPRIRPAHVQGMIFGWLLPVYMSMFYYMVPRLCGTKLYSEKLGIATTMVWAVGIIIATIGLLNPTDTLNLWFMTKGKEYEEYNPIANIFLLGRLGDAAGQHADDVRPADVHADVCRPLVRHGLPDVDGVRVRHRQLALAAPGRRQRLPGPERRQHQLVLRPQRRRPDRHARRPGHRLLHPAESGQRAACTATNCRWSASGRSARSTSGTARTT